MQIGLAAQAQQGEGPEQHRHDDGAAPHAEQACDQAREHPRCGQPGDQAEDFEGGKVH